MDMSRWLVESGIITESNKEVVEFGLKQMNIYILNLLIFFIVGVFFQKKVFSILFFLAFMIIRTYVGGFHAKTIKRCYVISLVLVFCSFSSLHIGIWTSTTCVISTVISSLILFLIVPIDSKNRRLDIVERKEFRKRALVLLSIEIIVEILGVILAYRVLYEAVALAICLTTVLAILGIYQNSRYISKPDPILK